ncbi:hypothetical protein [Neisseria dumasiana]|uniref:hypothetical protein n=1 Tax=Neisseria dumasiana TaxID=1931275 RepID=UPI000F790AED|nr:hypothetical protein [Neisseria dumasiana]
MQAIPVLKKFHQEADNYVQENYTKNGLSFKVPQLSTAEMKQIYSRFIHISLDATNKTVNPNIGTSEAKEKGPGDKPNLMRPIHPKVTEGYR